MFIKIIITVIGSLFLACDIQARYTSLESLIEDFEKLPKNRELNRNARSSGFELQEPRSVQDQVKMFKDEIEKWMKMRGQLLKQGTWKEANDSSLKPGDDFFNSSKPLSTFQPFAQKIESDPDNIYVMRGDLHGDISSLVQQLKDMKQQGLINDDFTLKAGINLVFLGDYVDRGQYGAEVLYTLARLGNANPCNTFYVRGNHEDIGIQARYGFKKELALKFGDIDASLHTWLSRMYDFMPSVIYLGHKDRYIMLCHGGIEQGYNPQNLLGSDQQFQLVGLLHRAKSVQEILDNPNISSSVKKMMQGIAEYMHDNVNPDSKHELPLGHLWNDFVPNGQDLIKVQPGRGIMYGQKGVDEVLNQQQGMKKIIGIIRAHQHTQEMMPKIIAAGGVVNMRCNQCDQLGQDPEHRDVLTMNLGPDSNVGLEYNFDDGVALHVTPKANGPWEAQKVYHNPFENKNVQKLVPTISISKIVKEPCDNKVFTVTVVTAATVIAVATVGALAYLMIPTQSDNQPEENE